ncbi:hypothetical protein HELRODRAFT_162972 [Helobdella robusta]|uniref:Uncharacterized protein n=1 Tax=Helobdella robusta TaxID=6412 RepID=T1ETG7_HELRO|nr:hypothetical protein HELRODRAFT_162972 [Helobdella robusta]ESN99424.1 hypothetical protein HELRODRAFT_162972 [Helobdella robusta]
MIPMKNPVFKKYAIYRKDRGIGRGGGLILLIHNSIPYSIKSLPDVPTIESGHHNQRKRHRYQHYQHLHPPKIHLPNSVLEKCSLFASVNLAKVLILDNIVKVNFKNLKNEIKEMLYAQQPIQLHSVLKRTLAPSGTLPRNEDEDSTMFRVCINASDTSKIQDPDNLPENVIIREWRFLKNRTSKVVVLGFFSRMVSIIQSWMKLRSPIV